uniref:Uncharacterized protein n=1 Tax=Oryza brachyantha TaxID=4533 RepID=J3NC78_ORYBR
YIPNLLSFLVHCVNYVTDKMKNQAASKKKNNIAIFVHLVVQGIVTRDNSAR